MATCMTILKKLDIFWRKADPSERQELIVQDAIIRSKLIYGLESAAMNETVKHKLGVFQLKGVRKILNIKTTFVDRANTNQAVLQAAQEKMSDREGNTKELKTYSQVYEQRKNKTTETTHYIRRRQPAKICNVPSRNTEANCSDDATRNETKNRKAKSKVAGNRIGNIVGFNRKNEQTRL